MGDVAGGDVQASPAPQLAAAYTVAPGGGVSSSQFSGTESGKHERDGGDLEAGKLVRGSGDAAESCPPIFSSFKKQAEDIWTQDTSHVQFTQASATCRTAALAVVSTPMKAVGGLAYNVSPSCEGPEAQEGVFGTRQPSGVSDLSDDGRPALGFNSSIPTTVPWRVHCQPGGGGSVMQTSAPFLVVPPPSEPQVAAGPTLHRADAVDVVSHFSHVNIEEGNISRSLLEPPSAWGKPLVSRGRPRTWSAESREETHKRVKIDELYGGASQSMKFTDLNAPPPPEDCFSPEGIEQLANADAAHDTTVLEPALLAHVNEAAFSTGTSAAFGKVQSHVPVATTEHFVDCEVEIPAKVSERSPILTQCSGITLNGNQCMHNVKDGSGFCVRHTKVLVDHSKRTGVEGSGASSRGVPFYKQPDAIVFRCRGKTLIGNQCTHNVKNGGVYCLKHGDQDRGPPPRRFEETMSYQTYPSAIPREVSVQIQIQMCVQAPPQEQAPIIAPPCMSRGVTRETRSSSKAKDMFTDIQNAGLLHGKVVSSDGQELVGRICQKVANDPRSGAQLLGFLAEEKERLRNILIDGRKGLAIVKPPDFWQTKYSPNLARTDSGMADNSKVRSKGDQNDALQTHPSVRFSSNAHDASETSLFFAQMIRQGSESARDVLVCAVCTKKFAEMPSLGKHWKENHKKEASMFLKGVACRECGQQYTSKGGLQRHWKSTHPTLPTSGSSLIVCTMCDAKFKDSNLLWMHVEEQHHLAFSSADFAQYLRNGILGVPRHGIKCSTCEEEFDTQLEFRNHNENLHNGLSSSGVSAVGGSQIAGPSSSRLTAKGNEPSPGKFFCKNCGQRFNLLPDLGRHHQAEHGNKSKNKLSTSLEGKFPPLVKSTPLPTPETASSPLGKMLPLAELSTPRSSTGIVEEGEHQTSIEWPRQTPAPDLQSHAFNFRHLETTAREKRKTEKDAPPVPLPAQPPVPPPAPTPAPVFAPKKRGRRKMMESLQINKLVPMKRKRGRPAKKIVEPTKVVQQSQQGRYGFGGQLADFRTLEEGLQAVSEVPLQRVKLEVDMAGFSEAPFKAQADLADDIGPKSLETVDVNDLTKGKRLVIYDDLSNGQEPVPIPCVIDAEVFLRPCVCASCRGNVGNSCLEIPDPLKGFSYINKRLLDPSLGLDTESSKLGCACKEGKCNPSHCDHVVMFDSDNDHACDKSGVAMKGRFPYDKQGRIILEEGYMVYECNSSCTCREDCQNRVLQRGVRVKIEVFRSRHKGWGVRAKEPIRSGTFICEYVGEVIDDRVANARGVRYDQEGCSYLFDIDAHLDLAVSRAGAKPFVIDATKHGNVARFINHSCAPNLINYEVLVESMDCQLAHIGFFARRDIAIGEELAYDYRYKLLPGKGTACHCNASNCRGRLY